MFRYSCVLAMAGLLLIAAGIPAVPAADREVEQLERAALCQAMPYRCPQGAAKATTQDLTTLTLPEDQQKQAQRALNEEKAFLESARFCVDVGEVAWFIGRAREQQQSYGMTQAQVMTLDPTIGPRVRHFLHQLVEDIYHRPPDTGLAVSQWYFGLCMRTGSSSPEGLLAILALLH